MGGKSDLWKELAAGDHHVETRLVIETKEGKLINEEGFYITFGGHRIALGDPMDPNNGAGEDKLISMKLRAKLFAGNAPSVGNCVAAQLDVQMIKPDTVIPKNARLIPYVRLTDGERHSGWLKKGTFYIDTRKETDDGNGRKRMTIRAYDALLKADQPYPETKLSWPAKDIDVVTEICEFLGLPSPGTWVTWYITGRYKVQYPAQYSCREVLGYIAAMYCTNCVLRTNGELAFVPYYYNYWEWSSVVQDISQRMASFSGEEAYMPYNKVELIVSEDKAYKEEKGEGKTLTAECPWGTQTMAADMLSKMRYINWRERFIYQPYKADVIMFSPTAELGSGIIANGVKSGVYDIEINFGPNYRVTVSAPWEDEPEHEFKYIPQRERKIRRQLHALTTELTIQAGLIQGEITDRINEIDVLESRITQNAESISTEVTARQNDVKSLQSNITQTATQISAKVSKTGGSSSSFEWNLTDSSWTLKSKGTTVLSATASGVEITGKITATSGEIGGLDIKDGYLSTRGQTWGGEVDGIYIGPEGIQLGTGFKVDRWGDITANSGTFAGEVYASMISYGEDYGGYFSGYGLEELSVQGYYGSHAWGQLDFGTISTENTTEGVNESLANADWAYGVLTGAEAFETVSALNVYTDELVVSDYMTFGGYQLYLGSFPDKNGNIQRCVQWYA